MDIIRDIHISSVYIQKRVWIWAIGLILIGVSILLKFSSAATLIMIILLLYSCFAPISELFLALFILAPNDSMLDISGFISLTSAVVVVCLAKLLIKERAKLDQGLILASSIMALSCIVRYAFTGEPYVTGTIKIIISFLLVGILAQQLHGLSFKDERVDKLGECFLLGCVILLLLSLVNFFFFDLSYNRMRPINGDPNYLSLYLAVGASISFLRLSYCSNSGRRIVFSIIWLFLFLAGGMLTQSRGFVVAIAPLVLLLTLKTCSFIIERPLLAFFIIILSIVAVITLVMTQDNLFEALYSRFISEETAGGSGRTLIWITYFQKWASSLQYLFFGVPQSALGNLRFEINSGEIIAVHNLYLEVILQYGLIFATAYFASVMILMKSFIGSIRPIGCIAILTLFLGYLFLSGALSVTLPFILAISCLAMNIPCNESCLTESAYK